MNSPKENLIIKIESTKHDQSFHRSWEENHILYNNEKVIIGVNDRTIVREPKKEPWRTEELAVFYFPRHHWFNIIILFKTRNDYSYYCNLSSPPTFKDRVIQYIDYDIDVIVHKNGDYEIVDLDEFVENKAEMAYPQAVINKIDSELLLLKSWIKKGRTPFNEDFVQTWYDRYGND